MQMPTWTCHLFFLVHALGKVLAAVEVQPKLIDSCERKISRSGEYRLEGWLRPHPFKRQQYCSLKILSPSGTKIQLEIEPEGDEVFQCTPSSSFLVFMDGWSLNQRQTRVRNQQPVCELPAVVSSSSNTAEIAYLLEPGNSVRIAVHFLKNPLDCGLTLSAQDFGKTLTISNGGQPGVCVWYLPGGIDLTVHNISLQQSSQQCGDESSNFFRVKSGHRMHTMKTWKTVCSKPAHAISAPCKHTLVELHSASSAPQSVTFSFQPEPYEQQIIAEYHCII